MLFPAPGSVKRWALGMDSGASLTLRPTTSAHATDGNVVRLRLYLFVLCLIRSLLALRATQARTRTGENEQAYHAHGTIMVKAHDCPRHGKTCGRANLELCFVEFYCARDCVATRPCAWRATLRRRRAQALRDKPMCIEARPAVIEYNLLRKIHQTWLLDESRRE